MLQELQDTITERLAGAPELAGVRVLARRPKVPLAELADALASAELGGWQYLGTYIADNKGKTLSLGSMWKKQVGVTP